MTRPYSLDVLSTGPSLRAHGGMVSVLEIILANPPDGVRLKHVATYMDGPVPLRVGTFAAAMAEVTWRMATAEPALVHAHMSQRSSVTRCLMVSGAARRARTPVILHAHGSEFASYLERLAPRRRERVASGIRRAAAVVVLSSSWKAIFCDDVGVDEERVHVLPNPVVLPVVARKPRRSDRLQVVALGRLGRRKGSFDLVGALAQLSEDDRRRIHVVMAGDGDVAGVRAEAQRLGVADAIDLPGWVEAKARDALLSGADVFVLPSYDEGLPMALLEAMAMALPVITTPVGGIPELVSDGVEGLLVSPGDVPALARSLYAMVRSPSTRDRLGLAARARVEPLGVPRYRSRLGALYRSVVEVGRG